MSEEKKQEDKKQLKPLLNKQWTFGILGFCVAWVLFSWLFHNTGAGFGFSMFLLACYGAWRWPKSRAWLKKQWNKDRESKI